MHDRPLTQAALGVLDARQAQLDFPDAPESTTGAAAVKVWHELRRLRADLSPAVALLASAGLHDVADEISIASAALARAADHVNLEP